MNKLGLALATLVCGSVAMKTYLSRRSGPHLFSAVILLLFLFSTPRSLHSAQPPPTWTSPKAFRLLLTVEPGAFKRSRSPVSVEFDLQHALAAQSAAAVFDEHTLEVVALDQIPSRQNRPSNEAQVPYRIDKLYGSTKVRLHFVMLDERHTNYAVYFDAMESKRGTPRRYHGLVGDGDLFREGYTQRDIGVCHFDCLADLDGDGDLDLFKGGVEPFVYCYENVGHYRFVEAGRLSSEGKLFHLPCSQDNRSWISVSFHDIDSDGDQDFFPSFGDGPDAGRIIFYQNTTREHGGPLTFTRIGVLTTVSGTPLAGGAQTGGRFPTITLVKDWDGDGAGPDALVGSNHRCWLYRHSGTTADGSIRFAQPAAVKTDGPELSNPRFDCADVDGDGDLDLFAASEFGPVYWYENRGSRLRPDLAAGQLLAWDGKYWIGDLFTGVAIADFDNDGLLDLMAGRFWERTDLRALEAPRDFGGFFKNVGSRTSPRFVRRAGGPCTERFQICDAVRQNGVRMVDWDHDGKFDLLAGDTDGFIWFFRRTDETFPVFEHGRRLLAAGRPLCTAPTGGHARFDLSDWNNDGRLDIVVADGQGTVTLFLNQGNRQNAVLAAGQPLTAGGKPIQLPGFRTNALVVSARASALVCDWNHDGRKDLVLADDKGYYFSQNTGSDNAPELLWPKPILFGGKKATYTRPNLGSFVDWDGDGKKDLIGCNFENSIRFYRNVGSGAPGTEPQFTDPEGVVLLQAESPQMISGADAVDWDGNGTIDLLSGQGHGGSGLRFYARDWLEDERRHTHPVVTVQRMEIKP